MTFSQITIGLSWGIVSSSTQWFDGVGVMDSFGLIHLIAPFGDDSCAHVRVFELDSVRVLNAAAGHRFIVVVSIDKSGQQRKHEFYFDKDYSDYTVYETKTDYQELNMAILDKGVCATIIEDGELAVFVPSTGSVKKTSDSQITTRMKLQSCMGKVLFFENDAVWQIKTT